MLSNYDVVIAALPFIETTEPMMAPALLKGVVNQTDLTCFTYDFNIEIIHLLDKESQHVKNSVERWFLYEENDQCQATQTCVDTLVDYVYDRIVILRPKWICLSLFCNTAKKFNTKLCQKLKKGYPSGKIVIGGNAVFTDKQSQRPYAKILHRAKLVDHYIVGDGEEPLYNLLTGTKQGIDNDEFQVLDDLSKQPLSDYDDYNWSLYETKRVPMYASRGCVRRCTFCDVYKIWKKFKLRHAEDVFDEMLYQIEKTGVRDFYFRDSLINGSVSEYRKLLKLLADYNSKNQEKITWTSFFIFRPQSQMDEEDWRLTAESGAQQLIVGVENLVESIRYHMRKKFTNQDMDFGLEMAKKYSVGLTLLLIVGYVNETEKDFEESIRWLESHAEFTPWPLSVLSIGGTLTVTDLTDLYQQAEDFDITIGDTIYLWENKSIGLNYEIREHRKKIFTDRAIQLGYNIIGHEKPVQ